MTLIDAQNVFVEMLAKHLPAKWDQIYIRYSNYESKYAPTEQYVSWYELNGKKEDLDVLVALIIDPSGLKKAIPDGQHKHWTWFEFELSPSGKYSFGYHYDIPPNVQEAIEAESKLGRSEV